jgi:hypothetical protein
MMNEAKWEELRQDEEMAYFRADLCLSSPESYSLEVKLFELERITPISVTTPVMHATMIDSIKNCLQRSRCPSSGGNV